MDSRLYKSEWETVPLFTITFSIKDSQQEDFRHATLLCSLEVLCTLGVTRIFIINEQQHSLYLRI